MEVQIIKRNSHGEEKHYKSFYWEREESIYSSPEVMFSHFMWNELAKRRHGHEFEYVKDWFDYKNAFNRLSYSGEGWYMKGKKVIGIKDMDDGMREIEIKNHLFFIKYLEL